MRDFGLDTDGDGLDDRPDADTGCGCTWRDTYPPVFSRVVLGHELGHYFGLAHAGHNGLDKIMISTGDGSSIFGADSWWRLWLYGDAVFTDEDVEQTWRFIVKKMPHVLRAVAWRTTWFSSSVSPRPGRARFSCMIGSASSS